MAHKSLERLSMTEAEWKARCAVRKAERSRRSIARRGLEAKKYFQKYYQEHKAEYRERGRAWRKANPDRARELRKMYRNPARERITTAAWRAANPDKVAATNQRLKEKRQRPEVKAARVAHQRERRHTDLQYAFKVSLQKTLLQRLRAHGVRKQHRMEEYLGCSIAELRSHLASKFLTGMTWENRHLWHIDHIRPCASFDLTDTIQQRACFHFTNLRPLWALDNIRKGRRWVNVTAIPILAAEHT
jgi:uncharacterized protein (DUF849 family)